MGHPKTFMSKTYAAVLKKTCFSQVIRCINQPRISLKKRQLDFLDKTSTAGSQHKFSHHSKSLPTSLERNCLWKHTLPKTNIAPSFQDRLPNNFFSGAIILVSRRVPLRSIQGVFLSKLQRWEKTWRFPHRFRNETACVHKLDLLFFP